MKFKALLLISGFVFLLSCSKDPQACIDLSTTSASVGEEVTFTSCSKNALSYIWSIEGPTGVEENDMQWSESSFVHAFAVGGKYKIELKAYKKYSWIGQPSTSEATITIN
ncbi:hypothetical protein K6119_05405 [Paracrocinitomix mangrovi]|uniref:hypothetical protein n=1 Tax=Paracrocinitomix mangrovi TaxID=2862509 RepID=UPI001C8D5A16|nr:hypothetical protein [Paracrocinitomix mangrovi]UKN02950.1 hypothetical protein K6119_05405 [Paracrocinitomix mangrovi]